MSWGIAETASEIEKIKSESADYLNGLNSCGVIDWNTYNYAFDFYEDLLIKAYEQGRKDAQSEIVRCKDCKHYGCILYSGTQFEHGVCFCHEESDYTFEVKPDDFCSRAERKR